MSKEKMRREAKEVGKELTETLSRFQVVADKFNGVYDYMNENEYSQYRNMVYTLVDTLPRMFQLQEQVLQRASE